MTDVETAVRNLSAVLRDRSSSAVDQVLYCRYAMHQIRLAPSGNVQAVLTALIELLSLEKPDRAGLAAMCCAALVERGIAPSLVAGLVMERAMPVLRAASRMYAQMRRHLMPLDDEAYFGEVLTDPTAMNEEFIDTTIRGKSKGAEAFRSLDTWCLAVLTILAPDREVRSSYRTDEMVRICSRLGEVHDGAASIGRLLTVLENEPLIVLHPMEAAGFECRISGISNIGQLHILLSDSIVGDGADQGGANALPGVRPSASAVRVANGVERSRVAWRVPTPWLFYQWPAILSGAQPTALTLGYSLDDTDGLERIWLFNGVRIVLIGPKRWPTVARRFEREFDLVSASIEVERRLPFTEFAQLSRSISRKAARRLRARTEED